MWLTTTSGFYSATLTWDGKQIQVRARDRNDLERLKDKYAPELGDIIETFDADYPYRALCQKDELPVIVFRIASDIDYKNFKDRVYDTQGHERSSIYGEVWRVLLRLENRDTKNKRDALYKSKRNKKTPQYFTARPVELMAGDVTEFGVVKYVASTRNNAKTTVTFEDDTVRTFVRFSEITVQA